MGKREKYRKRFVYALTIITIAWNTVLYQIKGKRQTCNPIIKYNIAIKWEERARENTQERVTDRMSEKERARQKAGERVTDRKRERERVREWERKREKKIGKKKRPIEGKGKLRKARTYIKRTLCRLIGIIPNTLA